MEAERDGQMDYRPDGPLFSAELSMPFPDSVKYILLGISVTLLLVALGILTWQTFRYCTQTHTPYTQQAAVNSDVLYLDEKPRTAENYSTAPSTKVEDIRTDVLRMSRCLPQVPFPSPDSIRSDGEVEERGNVKKPVDGSLRFSVHYDQLQSRLVVTILQVQGLQEHSQGGSVQPFVKVRLMWAGSQGLDVKEGDGAARPLWTVLQEWQTRVAKSSCNPLFGEEFSCVLEQENDMLHFTNLRMEVWDFDKFSRNTLLGEVRVPLRSLHIFDPLELHEDLQVPQKDLVGEVLLSLKFLPTSQRLEVGLLKVRTVLTEMCSDTALYARVSVQCNHYKLGYQKTSAVSQCLVTIFNEVLMFSLPEFPVEQCKVLVSVYEMHASWKSNKHLMGQLSVGKEKTSEDKHWNLMMRSVRQPVAKWHGLLI